MSGAGLFTRRRGGVRGAAALAAAKAPGTRWPIGSRTKVGGRRRDAGGEEAPLCLALLAGLRPGAGELRGVLVARGYAAPLGGTRSDDPAAAEPPGGGGEAVRRAVSYDGTVSGRAEPRSGPTNRRARKPKVCARVRGHGKAIPVVKNSALVSTRAVANPKPENPAARGRGAAAAEPRHGGPTDFTANDQPTARISDCARREAARRDVGEPSKPRLAGSSMKSDTAAEACGLHISQRGRGADIGPSGRIRTDQRRIWTRGQRAMGSKRSAPRQHRRIGIIGLRACEHRSMTAARAGDVAKPSSAHL